MNPRRFVSLIVLLLLVGAALSAQSWKAGVAKVDITPREPTWMAGYAARTKPSQGVLQPIYVKALALQDETGATSVLVTSDILGFTPSMTNPIVQQVEVKYGIKRARLALTSSHTHSGPVTGQLLRPAYQIPKEQEEVVRRYTDRLVDQVVEVVGAAVQNLGPATLEFEQGLAGFAVNRRRVGLRHLPGPVDQDVPVLAVKSPDGKLRAVVFGYACHATTLDGYEINGDWPGFAQAALERDHPGALALFIAGCGADANPLPRRTVELARMYGDIAAEAVGQTLKAKMVSVAGPLKTAFDLVDLPFAKTTRQDYEKLLNNSHFMYRAYARQMLDTLDRDGKLPSGYAYPVQVWQFGNSMKIILLGGEVVVDYALRLKAAHGWKNTWVAGYSNDVFAYIPSLRVLKEGGYEGGGAMVPYGQPGPFRTAVEEIVVEEVDELIGATK